MPFTELKPLHSYARMPPNLFNFQGTNDALLRAFYSLFCQMRVECPAEGYTVIDHCYIYDGCHVMTPDLEWVADTVTDYGIAEVIKPVIQDVIRGRHHRDLDPSPFKTVVIAKAGADNYGHVLTDILPKLVNIARSGLSAIRLLLPTGMQHFAGLISAFLQQAGVQADLQFHAPATLKEAREVYLFSPVGQHNTRKSTTFLELADRLSSLYEIRLERTRRIYVRRGHAEKRTFQDAAEVEAVFVRHGYQSIYPAELPLEEQIRLFASASHVAGAMGAGMANIGWAPPGCDVLMIDPGIGDFYFWDFSCLLSQRFNWLFAAPVTGYTPELAKNDYTVDLQLLQSTLTSLYG
jgi:capsular polysaccharide biosynthesis protein